MWRWIFLFFPLFVQCEISALYLSWYDDPTTTMTIQWHTDQDEQDILLLKMDDEWSPFEGSHITLDNLIIHKVSLENLKPDTEYSFRIQDETYKFRTAPQTIDTPLRFIIGGDIRSSTKLFRRMSETAIKTDPLFAVLGGDLAYAIKANPFKASGLRAWVAFLKDWKNYMITPDRRVIPFLLVPGNHDITPSNYELFFTLFAFPEKQLYRAIDFGSYLSLVLLDTGHFQPIEGRQTHWLNKTLSSKLDFPFRFAVYHEAAYPSFYPYHGKKPKKIRINWVPLFEKYNVLAAFENHNHAFKRTYPIKKNRINCSGVTYFGDGCWGASPRSTNDLWYLAKKGRKNSILLVELTAKEASVKALNLLGKAFDQVYFPIKVNN